jgi:transposase
MATIAPLVITDEERAELQRRVRAHTTPRRAAKRARIVLLAAEGVPNRQIAPIVGMNQHTVAHWRRRFQTDRLAGLTDRQRPGRPLVYDHDQRLRIVATVTQQPPDPASHWSHSQLAKPFPTSASRPPRSAGSWPTWTSSRTGCAAGSPAPTTRRSRSGPPTSAGCTWSRPPTRWC